MPEVWLNKFQFGLFFPVIGLLLAACDSSPKRLQGEKMAGGIESYLSFKEFKSSYLTNATGWQIIYYSTNRTSVGGIPDLLDVKINSFPIGNQTGELNVRFFKDCLYQIIYRPQSYQQFAQFLPTAGIILKKEDASGEILSTMVGNIEVWTVKDSLADMNLRFGWREKRLDSKFDSWVSP